MDRFVHTHSHNGNGKLANDAVDHQFCKKSQVVRTAIQRETHKIQIEYTQHKDIDVRTLRIYRICMYDQSAVFKIAISK